MGPNSVKDCGVGRKHVKKGSFVMKYSGSISVNLWSDSDPGGRQSRTRSQTIDSMFKGEVMENRYCKVSLVWKLSVTKRRRSPLSRTIFIIWQFFFSLYGSSYDLWRELALYLVAWFLFIILIYFKILSGQKNVEARYPDVPVMVWWTPFSGCYISLHGWSTFSLALFAKSVVTVVKTWILRM